MHCNLWRDKNLCSTNLMPYKFSVYTTDCFQCATSGDEAWYVCLASRLQCILFCLLTSIMYSLQVMLMVASETGHVYTFVTPKLQPMITSEAGKALIQICLYQPDTPPSAPSVSSGPPEQYDTRMSASGFEETDVNNSYQGNGQGNKVSVRVTVCVCVF